jgi:hypothetical protein
MSSPVETVVLGKPVQAGGLAPVKVWIRGNSMAVHLRVMIDGVRS